MNEYTKQAEDFLKETGTSFKAEYDRHGIHFIGDNHRRDIYKITFKRSGKQWTFKFGQSLKDSGSNKKPAAYDVLTCIQKYDPGTFDNFCADFGYDTDSRKAEKMYFAVQKEFSECEKMFHEVMDKLQEIA